MKASLKTVLAVWLCACNALAAGFEVHYANRNNYQFANQIQPHFIIYNKSGNSEYLKDLTLRYYYSKEGSAAEQLEIDYAAVGIPQVVRSLKSGYFELGFTANAGVIANNGNSGAIEIRLHKTDWTAYDQGNDYSFSATQTSFASFDRVALFKKGVLVWGKPPTDPQTDNPRALVVIDTRLYTKLRLLVDTYVAKAQARRGFPIGLRVVDNIDDWSYSTVKNWVKSQTQSNNLVQGVLYIGNIKLPSFYTSRADNEQVRLLPRYLEDLDGVFSKNFPDYSTFPRCDGTNDPYCSVNGPITMPRHDFDFIAKGANPRPELWAAFMPVGGGANTYTDFANQLTPYLQKVISFYNNQIITNKRYYYVSNDKGEQFPTVWDAFGKNAIDFYGKCGPNGVSGNDCITATGNVCYCRWPMETFAGAQAFIDEHDRCNVGEGWQEGSIFKGHMNGSLFDVVDVNVHSSSDFSLISSNDARNLSKAGLLIALSGCGVGGYAQPGSTSSVDLGHYADQNIMASFLYGSSKAIAALGDPFNRGHYAHFPTIYYEMKINRSYLGKAHFERTKLLYDNAASAGDFRENGMELLMGDPFMDLQ